ncbi:major capsid protein [Stenotrophomonas indicatrix]|uniref:major capsid protein n=1 Tax=Stenotrophomonas indicatrix TaxID=2045451 RepID=UPI0028EA4398|nr:major capsid protein [Stenotrophomonas indicatrix]MDT9580605.1 major capsid protein [Stenotrophomonas indicatrix]
MNKFFRAIKGKTAALVALGSTALVALPAMASGGGGAIDTAGVVSAVEGAGTAVGDIGKAVILVFVGIAVYKWVRRAL